MFILENLRNSIISQTEMIIESLANAKNADIEQ